MVHTFPKCNCPKVKVIYQVEFELAYNDTAVYCFNHYTTRTPLRKLEELDNNYQSYNWAQTNDYR